MAKRKSQARGIWYGVVTIRHGNDRHHHFYHGIHASEGAAMRSLLAAVRQEDRSRDVVNKVVYRVGDDLVRAAAALIGMVPAEGRA